MGCCPIFGSKKGKNATNTKIPKGIRSDQSDEDKPKGKTDRKKAGQIRNNQISPRISQPTQTLTPGRETNTDNNLYTC